MSKVQPLEFLKETKKQIDAHIFDFLPSEHDHPEVHQFYQMMLDYPLRSGKGLRPAICLLICEAFGGDTRKAINTAAALELLQNWALIHDDIEDGSDLRRGEPCLHQKYGIPIAINVGDGLHCKMWEMLNRNADLLGYELAFEIASEFAQLSNSIVEGQHIELSWVESNRWDLTEADYWTMCVKKTASYTCITPCRLGARHCGRVQKRDRIYSSIWARILGLPSRFRTMFSTSSARKDCMVKRLGETSAKENVLLFSSIC